MQLQWVHNFFNLSMEHFYSQVTTSKSVKKHIDANPLSATKSHSTVSELSLLFYPYYLLNLPLDRSVLSSETEFRGAWYCKVALGYSEALLRLRSLVFELA